MPDRIRIIPPWAAETDTEVEYFIDFPPFAWSLRRAEGWVTMQADINLADGVDRPLVVSVAQAANPKIYSIMVNLRGFDIVVFKIVDGPHPYIKDAVLTQPQL